MATVNNSEPDRGTPTLSAWVPDGIDLTRLAKDPFDRYARTRKAVRVVARHLLDGLILAGWNAIGADAALAMYLSRTSSHPEPDPEAVPERPPWM